MNENNNPIPDNSDIYIPTRKFTATESVFAWICFIFGYLFFRALSHFGDTARMVVTALFMVIATMVILFKRNRKFGLNWFGLGLISIIFSLSLCMSGTVLLQLLGISCASASYLLMIYTASGCRIEKGRSDMLPLDMFHAYLLYPFSSSPAHIFRATVANKAFKGKKILKVLAGLLISVVPTVFIIINLSYDDNFSGILEDIFEFFGDFDLFLQFTAVILGIILALYIFGLYVSSTNPEKKTFIKAEDCRNFGKTIRFVPVLTTAAALIPIAAVYIIFFISQWQYYVSAFTGVLPEGVESYSEYARSGFFQLCCVSVVNLIILFTVYLFMKRNTKKDSYFLKAAAVLFSVMTLILIGTALAKMWLYISAYGLTELRVLSSWFMVLLALIFLLIIFRQFIPKMKLVPCSGIAITLMLMLLLFSNYHKLIADYNVDRYLDGSIETVDVYKLDDLDDNGIPAMVRLAEEWDVTPDSKYENPDYSTSPEYDDEYKKFFLLWRALNEYRQETEELSATDRILGFTVPKNEAFNAINKWGK